MSNHHDDPWETEMSRTFDQRVRDLHEAPLTLDHVKGKATRIKRNRRIASAAAGLAAAAVLIPVAIFAGQGLTDQGSGPGPAETPSPNPTAVPGSLGFGYLEGRTLHLEDGSTVKLPERYYGVTVLGEEILAVRNNDDTGQDTLDVIGESGTVGESIEVQSGPVVNDDHTVVAYLTPDGAMNLRWESGGAGFSTDLDRNAFVSAVTGGPDCGADLCQVYVNDGAGGEPRVISSLGRSSVAVPGAIRVNDADESGLVTAQNESTIDGSCGGIYDENAGGYLWETCDYSLFAFSPDSRYVDATHAYLDGAGNGYAAILDASTGTEVARLEPPEGLIRQTVWQDAEHLLATVYDPEGWSIYRLDVNGDVDQVVGPSTKGDDVTPAYTLVDGS